LIDSSVLSRKSLTSRKVSRLLTKSATHSLETDSGDYYRDVRAQTRVVR